MLSNKNLYNVEFRTLLNILTAAMIFPVYFSCAPIVEEETTGTISGIVADKTTGEPVATAIISMSPGNISTVTGTDGSFQFKDIEAGNYTLEYSKEGYRPNSKTVTVQAGKTAESHMLIERIPAVITCDREVLDFGDNASMNTLSFNIVNNNYKDLNYTIIENCGWIVESDPSSGILPYGKTGTIVLRIDRELLTAGVNETVVVIRTEGEGSSELTVRAVGIEKKKPTLNVKEATDIKASSAMLNGEITDPGAPAYTERGFVYSESPMPDLDNTIAKMTASVTDNKDFSVRLSGLTLGDTYYVRAYATNELGTAYSTNQISFKTAATIPAVSFKGINTDAEGKSAILYGFITDAGDPEYHEKGFVYSTSDTYPTIYDNRLTVNGDNHGTFETKITSLEYDTEYYVRAYATNVAGTAYSGMSKILINTTLPVVVTKESTDMDTEHSVAVLHGEIADAGLPQYYEKGFVYSDIYESPTIYDSKFIVEGNGNGEFEYRCTELPSTKSYYIRAYAISDKGTSYGDVTKLFEKDWVILASHNIAVQKNDIGKGFGTHISDMCNNSNFEGYADWRLPTKDELYAIYLNRDKIGNFEEAEYWSSTTNSSGTLFCWYVDFRDGHSGTSPSYNNGIYNGVHYYGRCVRTLD